MPKPPEHQPTRKEVDETINEENEVDEASFESFPASDAPGWTGDHAMRADPVADEDQDEEEDA